MVELMHCGTLHTLSGATPAEPPRQDMRELDMLRMALNQVDYGMVVLDATTCAVQFTNARGREALGDANGEPGGVRGDTGLRLVLGRLVTRRPEDADLLLRTLARTRAGLRGLLSLGTGGEHTSVAVLPLVAPGPAGAAALDGDTAPPSPPLALLVFAKQSLCDDSTMALFARERGLTGAEGQVLAQVCRGLRPAQIADHHGVQISTVRTQLRSIRMKTCCDTIRELVQKVSVLPPMALHLHHNHPALT